MGLSVKRPLRNMFDLATEIIALLAVAAFFAGFIDSIAGAAA
jgi:hypothetical protein